MAEKATFNPHLIIPVGTQVVTLIEVKGRARGRVCPTGAVGEITASPQDNFHSYHVRFPDGTQAALRRHEFAVRKHHQAGELFRPEDALSDFDLYDYVIYSCVVGSRAYGLDGDASDVDRRGIYLPPAEMHWSLYGVPEQLENKSTEECYWELQKFLTLALKANPNVLECLYTPLVERATPLARELLEMRSAFLSKLIYQTYNGYVLSQFKKLEQDLRNRGQVRWKHAMHLVRLLLQGISVLRSGFLPVRVGEHRERFLAIRRGELPWGEVNAWRLALHRDFDLAFANTRLPERPDYERVNAFLIRARRVSAGRGGE
ncbi:MAG TPA: nucleotidyltransferase domain-containing protein [Pyrinomonadaceae bacterium]|nr:nucleotidyltransferase domain-containing protein [Pyrinomonadaceae bacterium]